MMIGTYPCCGASLMIPLPDIQLPAVGWEICECGEKVWHEFSRVDPKSWTDKDFHEEHEIDEETKKVKRKKD